MKIPYYPPDVYIHEGFRIPSTDGFSIGVRYSVAKRCLERLSNGIWQNFNCIGNSKDNDDPVLDNNTIMSLFDYIGDFPYSDGETSYKGYTYLGGLRLTSTNVTVDDFDYIGAKDVYIDNLELI